MGVTNPWHNIWLPFSPLKITQKNENSHLCKTSKVSEDKVL